ncbi:hypothetical protein MOMA_07171 [Moraxella macacae 0408225]|uniref:Lipoprotein n=1 Tax=Moraxella macacae 0408225 TaxID=1230338 RepID=L2F5I9_9GAMM|nr:hypothetical protein MOMA_07171 [Moraxella macacae 0408225]
MRAFGLTPLSLVKLNLMLIIYTAISGMLTGCITQYSKHQSSPIPVKVDLHTTKNECHSNLKPGQF